MSEYEKINTSVKCQMVARRREATKRVVILLGKVLLALVAFIGLEAIGFISTTFMVILMAIAICSGAFNAGWICRDIKF